MNELLRVALDASLEAGKAILDIYGSEDVGVEYKEDQSPLTRADRAAHEVLMKHLEPTGIPVLSEEGKHMPFEDRRGWDALWIVDPVDGTKEFIKRNGEFTVNVALVKAGRVVCGVVLAPVLGHAYVGEVGSGAWRCEVDMAGDTSVDQAWEARQALPLAQAQDRPFTVVASRSHMSPETEAYVEKARAGARRRELDQQRQFAEAVHGGRGNGGCLSAIRPHHGVGHRRGSGRVRSGRLRRGGPKHRRHHALQP